MFTLFTKLKLELLDKALPMACHLQLVLHRLLATIAALFGKPREHCLTEGFVSIQ